MITEWVISVSKTIGGIFRRMTELKELLLVVILSFPLNAYSVDWYKVGEENGNTFFVDMDDIKKENGFVYYWELVDLKEAIFGALSKISKFKANCENKEKAMLSTTSYTGQMGKYILINEAEYDGTKFSDASLSITAKFACKRAN
ncbi:MAG: hypothetical protein CBC42_04610 [Betaproteobacteria bacterium TMED82]|nr:MAG: hypothetical protein CBC42_04610 [Betaproteobacteria bacterium TMED82]|tara:strand:+ start:9647 stop:10081 length:435 start_codon:yes stop_codon:yes gene_type:complete